MLFTLNYNFENFQAFFLENWKIFLNSKFSAVNVQNPDLNKTYDSKWNVHWLDTKIYQPIRMLKNILHNPK